MGHEIRWYNEDKTVVFQKYTVGATKDDLYQLAQKSAEMLATVRHTVHLIIDEQLAGLVPTPSDMAYLESLLPPNQGAVAVIIQPSRIGYKGMVQNIGKVWGPNAFAQGYFVQSLEEARAFLEESFHVRFSDETVPDEL
jgi:hypothetical protein